jgi:hypothetical protein
MMRRYDVAQPMRRRVRGFNRSAMAIGGSLATSQNESQHILVVNDTEEILDLFRDIIGGLGHRMTAWSFSPDDLAKVTEIEPHEYAPVAQRIRAADFGLSRPMRCSPSVGGGA